MNNYPGMSFDRFCEEYEGQPVWNVGHPQQIFIDKFSTIAPKSPVLDVGCGIGDLAYYVAGLGCDVVGIDFVPKAIMIANQMTEGTIPSTTPGIILKTISEVASGTISRATPGSLSFIVGDVFKLYESSNTYSTVLDSCFFHTLDDSARRLYASNLWKVLEPGGEVHMLNLNVELPSEGVPRKVEARDIEQTFDTGWSIVEMESAQIRVTALSSCLPGIYARIKKE